MKVCTFNLEPLMENIRNQLDSLSAPLKRRLLLYQAYKTFDSILENKFEDVDLEEMADITKYNKCLDMKTRYEKLLDHLEGPFLETQDREVNEYAELYTDMKALIFSCELAGGLYHEDGRITNYAKTAALDLAEETFTLSDEAKRTVSHTAGSHIHQLLKMRKQKVSSNLM